VLDIIENCWTQFKKFGPHQKTSPPGVPSWLRAWMQTLVLRKSQEN